MTRTAAHSPFSLIWHSSHNPASLSLSTHLIRPASGRYNGRCAATVGKSHDHKHYQVKGG
jgi:hypothetical protein